MISRSVMRMSTILLAIVIFVSVAIVFKISVFIQKGSPVVKQQKDKVFNEQDYFRIKEGDPELTARNPELIEFIRRRILAPSKNKVSPFLTKTKDYSQVEQSSLVHRLLTHKTDYSQVGQSPLVDMLLGHKTEGFHLEVGAADGETFSNSLFFELERNWTGLLIEANPASYESMLLRNRHAYSINACLSPSNKTQALFFNPSGLLGGIFENMDESHKKAVKELDGNLEERVLIQCYPLISILQAIGLPPVIDYFSLDVEGPEIDILRTIPWAEVRINVFTIEFRCWDGNDVDEKNSKQKLMDIRKILIEETGLYEEVDVLPYNAIEELALDVVFKRKDLKTK